MTSPERIRSLTDFLLLADEMKRIERRTYVPGTGGRHENDAEHCFHMGLCALVLHGELGVEADLGRVLSLVLAHDLVEIYAGDTYAYDDAGLAGQKAREEEAAEKLFGSLPPDVGARLESLWREFEAGETNEAKVALACDRMQGFMQNFHSGGQAWRENGVTRERTKRRMEPAYSTDPVFAAVLDELYARADAADMFNPANE